MTFHQSTLLSRHVVNVNKVMRILVCHRFNITISSLAIINSLVAQYKQHVPLMSFSAMALIAPENQFDMNARMKVSCKLSAWERNKNVPMCRVTSFKDISKIVLHLTSVNCAVAYSQCMFQYITTVQFISFKYLDETVLV